MKSKTRKAAGKASLDPLVRSLTALALTYRRRQLLTRKHNVYASAIWRTASEDIIRALDANVAGDAARTDAQRLFVLASTWLVRQLS